MCAIIITFHACGKTAAIAKATWRSQAFWIVVCVNWLQKEIEQDIYISIKVPPSLSSSASSTIPFKIRFRFTATDGWMEAQTLAGTRRYTHTYASTYSHICWARERRECNAMADGKIKEMEKIFAFKALKAFSRCYSVQLVWKSEMVKKVFHREIDSSALNINSFESNICKLWELIERKSDLGCQMSDVRKSIKIKSKVKYLLWF